MEAIVGVFEINEDHDFGVRYGNFVVILNSLEKYLAKCPDIERFTQKAQIKNFIVINDILKNDKQQLEYLAEILLFMTSISSKKEDYLEKIEEIDDIRYVNLFFQLIEKYIVLEKVEETNNLANQSHLDHSYMISTHFMKMKDEYETERKNLIKLIKEGENQIASLKWRNENLEKALSDTEMKLKDKEREYEMVNTVQNQNIIIQEQLFKDSLANTDLFNQLTQKDLEIGDLKREIDLITKRHNGEIQKLKEKVETQDDKIQEYKSIKSQYDKLNAKYKEINITKDKKCDCEEIKLSLEQKNRQIEHLLKEKQGFSQQLENVSKEIYSEKEKCRQSDYERKKLEYDITDMKKELASLKALGGLNINNISALENQGEDIKLFDVAGDSLLFDDFHEMKRGNSTNAIEREFIELRNEKNEFAKLYKGQIDEIHKLIDEKERLLNSMDSLKLEVERSNSEKERLGIEREKVEIQIQKLDLENQKLAIHLERVENEKKRIEEDNKELMDKIESQMFDKNLKSKELEKSKGELTNSKSMVEKLLHDKQGLVNEYQHLVAEFDKYKQTHDNQKKGATIKSGKNSNPTSNNMPSDTEILAMKNEIQNLKLTLIQKDETIKTLKDKVAIYESNEFSGEECSKKAEELDYYKKSYEEQKLRVNKEHELITNSLYELALQFMNVKNELQKKVSGK